MRQVITFGAAEIEITSTEMPEVPYPEAPYPGDIRHEMNIEFEIGNLYGSATAGARVSLKSVGLDEVKALSMALRRAVVAMTTPQKETKIAY